MKITIMSLIVVLVFAILAAGSYAQSPREQLQQMVEQLQKTPNDNALREKIIKLGSEIKPAPAIPEEARRPFVEGVTIVKAAKDAGSQELAVESFNEALKIAPWWGDAYYNLAVTQELTGQLTQAEQTLKWFILSNPGETEARDAQDRIYAIGAKRKLAAADAAKEKAAAAAKAKADETLIAPGQRIGRITVGMAPGKLREILGEPSETDNIGSWWRNYRWNSAGLHVSIKMSLDAVDSVSVSGPATQYRTAEGLGVGSSESEIQSRMGVPQRSGRLTNGGFNKYCYRLGMKLLSRAGKVEYIEVFRPAGFDATYCEARSFSEFWTNN